MPEIPDLEGYAAYFNKRLPGLKVESVEMPIAWMVRTGREEFEARMPGQVIKHPVHRVAKMLFFPFESGDYLAVHAMLAGRYQYVTPETKRPRMAAWLLGLSNGMELRYFDERRMGRTYLVRPEEFAEKLPRWTEMGPDVLDPELTADRFVEIMKPHRGMIKSIITNERVIAGIGNAYSDEVLWEARVHPFRKRVDMTDAELRELFHAIRRVMERSTPIVTQLLEEKGLPVRMYRAHLAVHDKAEEACPRDGHRVSSVKSGGRETNFCRECQK